MEPHRRRVRKAARERPEPRERLRRSRLVEAPDRSGDLGLGVRGRLPGRPGEDLRGGALPPEPL